MHLALSVHHKTDAGYCRSWHGPNISHCMSLSPYLLDAIVFSVVKPEPAKRQPLAVVPGACAARGGAVPGLGENVADSTRMIDREMP